MENLLESWNLVKNRIGGKKICVFLDYDGTLTPITSSPSTATIGENTKQTLVSLSENTRCHVAIISGREINDLKKLVDIPSLWYSGNHGLEIETPNVKYKKSLPASYLSLLRILYDALTTELRKFKGVLVEDKGVTISVHYRNLHPGFELDFHDEFLKITDLYIPDGLFRINRGKMVLEIKPNIDWNKGSAVLRLLSEINYEPEVHLPFYFGDDTTDEDAFAAIREFGITVRVGNKTAPTNAEFCLKDPEEVEMFLIKINTLLQIAVNQKDTN